MKFFDTDFHHETEGAGNLLPPKKRRCFGACRSNEQNFEIMFRLINMITYVFTIYNDDINR